MAFPIQFLSYVDNSEDPFAGASNLWSGAVNFVGNSVVVAAAGLALAKITCVALDALGYAYAATWGSTALTAGSVAVLVPAAALGGVILGVAVFNHVMIGLVRSR